MEITALAYDAMEAPVAFALRRERGEDAAADISARAYDTVGISEEARALARTQAGGNAGDADSATDSGENLEERTAKEREPGYGGKAVATGIAAKQTSEDSASSVETLQKRIQETAQKLADAMAELNQAMAENRPQASDAGKPAPSAGAPAPSRTGETEHPDATRMSGRESEAENPAAMRTGGQDAGVKNAEEAQAAVSARAPAGPAESVAVKTLQLKISALNAELMELRQALQEAIKNENQ